MAGVKKKKEEVAEIQEEKVEAGKTETPEEKPQAKEGVIEKEEPKIVKTDDDAQDGQNKCPKCGSTDISLNSKKGLLRCNFCRHEFKAEKEVGWETDISKLKGEVIGSGAKNIDKNAKDTVTIKCTSCGAEVVIDTSDSTQARCHWCRNTLSLNKQIPNGAIPDMVLPFSISKEDAKNQIEEFVGNRKFFANPKFKAEFSSENVMGVYLPYMIVDVNAHAEFIGQGEIETRKYTVSEETLYDADLYDVSREFDVAIEGLTVESSSDKLDKHAKGKTNNIINSIMPFDIENALKWNANYLKGYSSEKRDTDIDALRPIVDVQSKDIARFSAHETLKQYNRGVKWSKEDLDVKGKQWKTAYLPVWLYSYMEQKGENGLLHYVAVNARTKETMGSVPVHMPKLFAISVLVEILSLIAAIFVVTITDKNWAWLFLIGGFIYFGIIYSKYRNTNVRHSYETETKQSKSNVVKTDKFVKKKTGLNNSKMDGANNERISG